MKSCVVTIIKNEHLYLNEWIRYHLDLGIAHIFIFEDVDSESHREITDQYAGQVTLNGVASLLDESELKYVRLMKKTKRDNPQHVYFRKAIEYIQSLFVYDWCFEIDVDEFITLDVDDADLSQILMLYRDYDAVLLQWRCYGANGLVHKPDYSCAGVVDTYTQPIQSFHLGPKPDEWSKRVVYNLHTYKPGFFMCVHQPSDKCNFCNTRFERDRKSRIYDKIYIRHYITKSWEEYVWKKQIRGYFMGFVRSLNAFFELNPDFEPLKDQLLLDTKDEILVILPYARRGAQGDELRLALSCWRKFCTFKYRFIIVGDPSPSLIEEFPWVEVMYTSPRSPVSGQYNPHLDIVSKMVLASKDLRTKYPGFIWMTDDEYAIKPFALEDITTIHYHQKSFVGVESLPTSFWKHDKWKTRQLLDRENFPHVNYTTHFPCYLLFSRFRKLWDAYNMTNESYVLEDVYFNSFDHSEPVLDDEIRFGIWNRQIFDKRFDDAVKNPNIKFVCNSPEGWSPELEIALQSIIEQ